MTLNLPKGDAQVPLGVLVNGLDAESIDYVRKRLVGVQMLACVQNNLMDDIQNRLREKHRYKYDVKRNMGQIKKLCMANMGNKNFLGQLSQEALDVYFEDFERLEKWIYDFLLSDD